VYAGCVSEDKKYKRCMNVEIENTEQVRRCMGMHTSLYMRLASTLVGRWMSSPGCDRVDVLALCQRYARRSRP
jgi:hypothetical protein